MTIINGVDCTCSLYTHIITHHHTVIQHTYALLVLARQVLEKVLLLN